MHYNCNTCNFISIMIINRASFRALAVAEEQLTYSLTYHVTRLMQPSLERGSLSTCTLLSLLIKVS